jgi:hypothetical protein
VAEFKPAPGVRLFIIDDEAIVYAHAAQKLYAFNTAATFIWCGLELGQGEAEVTQGLAYASGISAEEAGRRVAEALGSWRDLGLLAGSVADERRPPRRFRERPRGRPASSLAAYATARFVDERVYALLGAAIRVRFASMEQRDFVHPILAHLERPDAAPTATVDLVEDAGTHHICLDGAIENSCDGIDRIGPVVKWLVWEAAVNTHRFFLDIHAGVVGDGESVILLPAASGSGKSSLTAALSRAGFDYFSDEIALLEEPGLTVRPIPLAVCVKSTGWDVMAPFFPEVRSLKSHHRGDNKIVRYVPPPPFTNGSDAGRSYPVRRIIFPQYRPGAATALKPLARVAALQRLMAECLVVPVPLTLRRITRLVRWIKQIDCYELPMSSLEHAVELVRGAGRVPQRGM